MSKCLEQLQNYLLAHGVHWERAPAAPAPGTDTAQVIMARVDAQLIMLILPAAARVDWTHIQALLHAQSARPAAAAEFTSLLPACDAGAVPPFGHLYGVPAYLDQSFVFAEALIFPAGDRQTLLQIVLADYLRLAAPTVVALTPPA